jgi:four helix bundle protein
MRDANELFERIRKLTLLVLAFCRRLPRTPEAQDAGRQLYRAANGARSNYRAARRGRSRAEFVAKLGVAVEESDEVVDWLEFMRDGGIAHDAKLLAEAQEMRNILAKSAATARTNSRARPVP